ncbi:MAG: type I-C CRISPR-associated protein Cas8c/Csd1 [Oscillospiraceae bacterium]
MSWISKLYETYQDCESLIGVISDDGKTPLLPIEHTTQNAQIEVTIDENGDFLTAEKVDKSSNVTIIPCSEKSAGRTGKSFVPHPLFDNLRYVAGDFEKYAKIENPDKFFPVYIKQLESWCNSSFSHPKVNTIFTYLTKKTLVADLIKTGILVCDEEGMLDEKARISNILLPKAFVRFSVNIPDDYEPRTWLDKDVWNSYIAYSTQQQGETSLCYVTGKNVSCSENHPSKIRNTNDQAKLISSNAPWGPTTFLGRFLDKKEVVNVGYEVSQKAHNALKWLINKQGYQNGDYASVTWGTKNEDLPRIDKNSDDIFAEYDDDYSPPTTEKAYADKMSLLIAGYRTKIAPHSEIQVMALDSTSDRNRGALSIVYYRELSGSDYLDRVQKWYSTCVWFYRYRIVSDGFDAKGKPKTKMVPSFGTPSPKEIIAAAYGKNVNDKFSKKLNEQLMHCVIDSQPIPISIVTCGFNRSSMPLSMEEREWEKTLYVTCALIKKYYFDKKGVDISMENNSIKDSRSYLYGRYLAVLDQIENWALFELKTDRPTAAIRYFNQFIDNPEKTNIIIRKALAPYIEKLGKKCDFYLKLLGEIEGKLVELGLATQKGKLDYMFLIGFDCQRRELREPNKQKNKDSEE